MGLLKCMSAPIASLGSTIIYIRNISAGYILKIIDKEFAGDN